MYDAGKGNRSAKAKGVQGREGSLHRLRSRGDIVNPKP